MTVFYIMSGLALLAAGGSLALAIIERKRNLKRNAALKALGETLCAMEKDIAQLKAGVTPDYEQAKAAADAVNGFNKGIAAILGFDPHEAYQKAKQEERHGGEVV